MHKRISVSITKTHNNNTDAKHEDLFREALCDNSAMLGNCMFNPKTRQHNVQACISSELEAHIVSWGMHVL